MGGKREKVRYEMGIRLRDQRETAFERRCNDHHQEAHLNYKRRRRRKGKEKKEEEREEVRER